MRKIVLLMLVLSVGLSAKIWVNAIRDPGAELGQGDWTTEIEEYKEGGADSAVVSVHDSTRAYEGKYSFLTDTKKYCGVVDAVARVKCKQSLQIPKAVKDIDSCFWNIDMEKGNTTLVYTFFLLCKSKE
ncbi:hypothetical protein GX441_10225, partial [bacterium]|nr:hypothetical protein [bacterium]